MNKPFTVEKTFTKITDTERVTRYHATIWDRATREITTIEILKTKALEANDRNNQARSE